MHVPYLEEAGDPSRELTWSEPPAPAHPGAVLPFGAGRLQGRGCVGALHCPSICSRADSPVAGAALGSGQRVTGLGNRKEGLPAPLQGAPQHAAANGRQGSGALFSFIPSLFSELIWVAAH